MTVKDIITNTSFDDVMKVIDIHYGLAEEEKQRLLYDKLKTMELSPDVGGVTLYINAFMDDGNEDAEDICLTEFDEYDTNLYFDVSVFEEGDEYAYSISATPFRELLGYEISEETRGKLTDASILAHVLWEATSYSYKNFV